MAVGCGVETRTRKAWGMNPAVSLTFTPRRFHCLYYIILSTVCQIEHKLIPGTCRDKRPVTPISYSSRAKFVLPYINIITIVFHSLMVKIFSTNKTYVAICFWEETVYIFIGVCLSYIEFSI